MENSATKIVTFYSFKGGVGRTMALVNTASALAMQGFRVLLIDFDLEAPGMTHFFAPSITHNVGPAGFDALDFLIHAKEALNHSRPPELGLSAYTQRIDLGKMNRQDSWTQEVQYFNGRLDLIPATLEPIKVAGGREEAQSNASYLERLDQLALSEIFRSNGPRSKFSNLIRGFLLNARFRTAGFELLTLRDKITASYDFVFVDSRTGLNEISGLSIGPLADALVICTGLNQQNIEGTRYFMDAAGLLDVKRRKPVTIVAGPVPAWSTNLADEKIDTMKKCFKVDEVLEIPYHPTAAIEESLFVKSEPKDPISRAYLELAPAILKSLSEELPNRQMRADGSTLDFPASLAREVLFALPLYRRGTLERHRIRAVPAPFPTGFSLVSASSDFLGSLPFIAANSAHRLRSEKPFVQAHHILDSVERPHQEYIRTRLLYFHLKSGFTEELLERTDLTRFLEENLEFSRRILRRQTFRGDPSRALNSLLTTLQLPASLSDGFGSRPKLVEATRPFLNLSYTDSMQHLIHASLVSSDKLRSDKSIRDGLNQLTKALENITLGYYGEARDVISQGGFLELARTLASSMGDFQLRAPYGIGRHPVFDDPVTMDLQPAFASALALVHGEKAPREVVRWLALTRQSYGYAWRVLVDWNCIEYVAESSAFKAFISSEDEHVERLEGLLDSGEATL